MGSDPHHMVSGGRYQAFGTAQVQKAFFVLLKESMAQKRTMTVILLMAVSMVAGAFGSAVLAHNLVDGAAGFGLWTLALGAVFGGVGWLLGENIGDAAFLLLLTGLVGAVLLAFLQGEMLRIVVIAFLCGFNTGKIIGGIYREYRA